jgi:tetratricopeptide (TPR) repeat protein
MKGRVGAPFLLGRRTTGRVVRRPRTLHNNGSGRLIRSPCRRGAGERDGQAGRGGRRLCEALKERTRERVPLDWAMTQMNLGNALATLGERESGTGKLEEAVAAYREALKEGTRERVPLEWAMTQMNLGNALARLGERESGTGKLEEAVAAYREALKDLTPETTSYGHELAQRNLVRGLALLQQRQKQK